MKFSLTLLVFLIATGSGVLSSSKILTCKPGTPFPWKFFGKQEYSVNAASPTTTFESNCFKENIITFSWSDDTTIELEIESQGKKGGWFCSETFLLTDMFKHEFKVKMFEGSNKAYFKTVSDRQKDYIQKFGMKVIPLCDHFVNLIPDILYTVAGFITKIIPDKFQPKELKHYISEMTMHEQAVMMGTRIIPRTEAKHLGIPWMRDNLKDGDSFCLVDYNGIALMQNWATGGQCSHVGVFMWGPGDDSNNLYVLESSAEGVKKTVVEKWYQPPDEITDDSLFGVLQLSDESRLKYDSTKAWAAFYKIEGFPYGFENFLFAAIDTPDLNWPQVMNGDTFILFVSLAYQIPGAKKGLDMMVGDGFNHRLGTTGLDMLEIFEEATKKGITLSELFAIPENPEWVYGTGKTRGQRYVCSGFVALLLQKSGVLADYDISPQEFTPKDIMNLKVWSQKPPAPECLANDLYLPFCQIHGHYSLDPTNFNTIDPYDHMNERCGAMAPFYFRSPEDC